MRTAEHDAFGAPVSARVEQHVIPARAPTSQVRGASGRRAHYKFLPRWPLASLTSAAEARKD
jgi:hypothetical protein